jgi:hypothetical protein
MDIYLVHMRRTNLYYSKHVDCVPTDIHLSFILYECEMWLHYFEEILYAESA